MGELVLQEMVESKIFIIRGFKVMLSADLAKLYGTGPKVLIQAVKRNIERFPGDFMFQLTPEEARNSWSQFVTMKQGQNLKYLPYAFTEQGVAMLSSVLNSERAIAVNIQIMRAFVKLKKNLLAYKKLYQKIGELERKVGKHDEDILVIFEAIRQLMAPPPDKPRRIIGFKQQ